jgi:16S rRNA (cytosine967-C5)-methyltransferase
VTRGGDVRAEAARVVAEVAGRRRSLDRALSGDLSAWSDPRDRALLRALSYGVIRFYPRLERLLANMLQKSLKPRDLPLKCLLMVGLHQISAMKVPDHAAVSATVSAATAIGRPGARGLVNAVLRRYLREKEDLDAAVASTPEGRWAHPEWMVKRIAADWPDRWETVLEANNQPPPMWLRVNRSRVDRDAWLKSLAPEGATAGAIAPESVLLAIPCDVEAIDGFARGTVSVQDAGAQLAAHLLGAVPGDRVLDACAAPGGKAAHVLELCPEADLDAV